VPRANRLIGGQRYGRDPGPGLFNCRIESIDDGLGDGSMTDWATISSIATAGGTLVLAIATFGSTRSANANARVAERALLASQRPVLIPSREDDPGEQIRFVDDVVLRLPGHATRDGRAGRARVLDLIYGDYEGGQRTVARFTLPSRKDDGGARIDIVRYWSLDGTDPRPR
jgi:hypothetical protein